MQPSNLPIDILIRTQKLDEALLSTEEIEDEKLKILYKSKILFLQSKYQESYLLLTQANIDPADPIFKDVYDAIEAAFKADLEHIHKSNLFSTKEKILESLRSSSMEHQSSMIISKHTTPFRKKIFYSLGSFLGWMSSAMIGWLTHITGKLSGYKDEIWTNWYRKPVFIGILLLAYMRNLLNRKNLFNTYTTRKKNNINASLEAPNQNTIRFRTINGSFNNLNNPMEGAAGTRFQRNVSPAASNSIKSDHLYFPNPRTISLELLKRQGPMKEVPFLNMLAAAWIQFQNHDWISHPESLDLQVHEIDLSGTDPIFTKYHQSKLFIAKSFPDPLADEDDPYQYNFINEVTHWWDGSQIYGSDQTTAESLRTFTSGKMIISDQGLLPLDGFGHERSGYTRNWWLGLSLFHTLFTLEHNAICDRLIKGYPSWNDHQLYHTARLINAALMAKIHTLEWNSAINPNPSIYKGNHSNWYGLLTILMNKKEDWKTIEEINIRNTELGGVVGNPINKNGGDFGLTQEFVEAYRIHSMLPEDIKIKKMNDASFDLSIPFVHTRHKGAYDCIQKYGIQNIWYSLGMQHPGQVVLNNYPAFMQNLSIPGNPVYDMGTVDILRARERGVPRYNEFRRQLGLNPLNCIEDITDNKTVINKLKEIYGPDGIEEVDLMIGTLAESRRPTAFAFGETMFQLFLLNATRRLQADRFFTDCYNSSYYTEEGMQWIDSNNLKSVLLRHYPDLMNTGLKNVTNAFEPWDDALPLHPGRHPLSVFERK